MAEKVEKDKRKHRWNKDQVKHWADVLGKVASAQFVFLVGKNLFLNALSNGFDWLVLGLSAVIYLLIHVIIHRLLSRLGE